MFIQQLINGLTLGAIYSLIALGYTLVYGILRLINFAHSEVLMLGAFIGLGVLTFFPAAFQAGPLGLTTVFVLSMLGSGVLNMFIEKCAYRPLRHTLSLAPLISAIGISIILQNAVFLWITNQSQTFPEIVVPTNFSIGPATLNSLQLVILFTSLVLMVLLHLFIQKTKTGKAMRACADDLEAAALMGIDSNQIIGITFLVGGALGGAAGVLNGMYYGSIKYNLGFLPGVKAFTAAVLGGIGNIQGAVLGGFILGILEVAAAGYLPNGSEWKDVVAFVILIFVLLIRPTGILGEKIAEKV
ncbi:MAG: branched-chain amino acid ABC transporter permease [Elusimicrobia bacterium]|nr:branched-chain amino acid ABC transporter permease [Elusimicrobiota bacterium]